MKLSDAEIDETISEIVDKWTYVMTTFQYQADSRLAEQIKDFLPPISSFITKKFNLHDEEKKSFALSTYLVGVAIVKSGSHTKEEVEQAYAAMLTAPKGFFDSPFFALRSAKIISLYLLGFIAYTAGLSLIFTPEAVGTIAGLSAVGLGVAAITQIRKK